MTNMLIAAGLSLWGIAALFSMALIRGSTDQDSTEIQHRECEP